MRFNVSRPSDLLHCVWLIFAATCLQRDMRDEMEQHWADRHAAKVANKERSSAALSGYTTVNPFWIKKNKEETFLVIEAAPDALHIDHCLLFLFLFCFETISHSINFSVPTSKWLLNLNARIVLTPPSTNKTSRQYSGNYLPPSLTVI